VDYLSANRLPWLADSQQKLRDSHAADRMPHSLLLVSPPGLGALPFAHWITAFALCDSAVNRPCGVCASCLLLRADSHPDVHAVSLEEKAQQIKIEQVRELIESLALRSYRGGYKVGLIESAEALNTHSANAFLKTLEEPTAHTLLIMIAKPTHRLPATIASRCLRMALRAPAPQMAKAWLQANAAPQATWDTALELAGGAPLLALQLDAASLTTLDAEMQASLSQLAEGSVDISLLAEFWLREGSELRIHWLENWITRRVQAALGQPNSDQSAEPVRLPAALLKPKIRPLFELLDAARDYRRLAVTGLNQQLALEALLVGGRTALAK
jgi:DNA polymerase III subunit delta'